MIVRKHLLRTTEESAKKFMLDVESFKIWEAKKMRNKKTGELYIQISFVVEEVKKT